MTESDDALGLTPGKGLIVLLCVVTGIAGYVAIGWALGIVPLYAGFVFAVYFGGIKHSEPREFAAALLGSLAGLLIAAVLYVLVRDFSTTGLGVALLLIVVALYMQLMGWLRLLINDAFMLMLTIAAIPALQAEAAFIGMACAILLAATMLGALVLVAGRMARRAATKE